MTQLRLTFVSKQSCIIVYNESKNIINCKIVSVKKHIQLGWAIWVYSRSGSVRFGIDPFKN